MEGSSGLFVGMLTQALPASVPSRTEMGILFGSSRGLGFRVEDVGFRVEDLGI